jgi:hypothetical protein
MPNHDNYVIFDKFVVSGQPAMIRVAYSVPNVEHTLTLAVASRYLYTTTIVIVCSCTGSTGGK